MKSFREFINEESKDMSKTDIARLKSIASTLTKSLEDLYKLQN